MEKTEHLTSINKVVLIGAGNAAYHFALALKAVGKNIEQIYNRTEEKAALLATLVGAEATSDPAMIIPDADIYILAVSDSAVLELSKKLRFPNKIVVHLAGSLPMNVLNSISVRNGVMYPLQTLSVDSITNFSQIPLCIEASDDNTLQFLAMLAYELSTAVYFFDSERRKGLHLAAVFASNFVNCLNSVALNIAKEQNIPAELLLPIIEETAKRSQWGNPEDYQTGPAVRYDAAVIKTQLDALKWNPSYQALYKILTQVIQEQQKKKIENGL